MEEENTAELQEAPSDAQDKNEAETTAEEDLPPDSALVEIDTTGAEEEIGLDENIPTEDEKEGADELDDTLQEEKEPGDTEQTDTEENLKEKEEISEEPKDDDEAEDAELVEEGTEVKEETDEMVPKESEVTTEETVTDKQEETAKTKDEQKETEEKKDSMDYETAPRFRDFEDVQRPSGDFLIGDEGVAAPVKFYKYMEEGEEEEEEELGLEMEEEIIKIDRGPYYEKHARLTEIIEDERIKNNIIQKKLAMFFKRRRMEHVLKESDQQVDTQQKYGKKLDAYGELLEIDFRQRTTITQELENLKETRESKCEELQTLFEHLQAREREIGFGLINTKTGKTIPDKLVERLIRLQNTEMETVSIMRLKFIKLKYLVAEKQEAITIIDKIGEDLYLMDFEQLKVENRGLADKIEERDEELTKLRSKCQTTIQILAHIREKTSALESDIDDLKDDLSGVDTQSLQVREQLNSLKQQRDYYRNMSNKLRSDSGLLIEIELLRDMEDSMGELNLMTEELEHLKAENKVKAQQIRNIRKNIEFATEGLAKKSYKNIPEKSLAHPHLYKGRPSLYTPTLPEDAFKHLRYFKPKPMGRSKKKIK